mmetsp:Transcript_43601/g.108312  ORF Transcript_43601/g.108312 Transcript_43601/m.108312 type:complete len:242 (+) Transcript_43601:1864-2589(+)
MRRLAVLFVDVVHDVAVPLVQQAKLLVRNPLFFKVDNAVDGRLAVAVVVRLFFFALGAADLHVGSDLGIGLLRRRLGHTPAPPPKIAECGWGGRREEVCELVLERHRLRTLQHLDCDHFAAAVLLQVAGDAAHGRSLLRRRCLPADPAVDLGTHVDEIHFTAREDAFGGEQPGVGDLAHREVARVVGAAQHLGLHGLDALVVLLRRCDRSLSAQPRPEGSALAPLVQHLNPRLAPVLLVAQ